MFYKEWHTNYDLKQRHTNRSVDSCNLNYKCTFTTKEWYEVTANGQVEITFLSYTEEMARRMQCLCMTYHTAFSLSAAITGNLEGLMLH